MSPLRTDGPLPNETLRALRRARNWSRNRLACELELIGRELNIALPERPSIEKAIQRHESGRTRAPEEPYIRLYCEAFQSTPHELFGDLDHIGATGSTFDVTNHKFLPIYLGADAVRILGHRLDGSPRILDWAECWVADIDHWSGRCQVYGFEWGVIVLHLVEEVQSESLAGVARWRRETHRRERDWAEAHLNSLLGDLVPQTRPEYVLSAWWMTRPKWEGAELETAMRILCTPRVLLDHGPDARLEHAEMVERSLLEDGYDDPRIVAFGVQGVSIGYASWAGVTYFPRAERRALTEDQMGALQVVVQALWCYCHHLRSQVAGGVDPALDSRHGWRWLRGMKARLGGQPQETAQHAAFRSAVLQTSELSNHLADSIEMISHIES